MSEHHTQTTSERMPIYCPVSIWGDPSQSDGICVDISVGGMVLAVAHPVPVGTLLRVTALLPDGPALDATVVVVWSNSGGEHRLGVRFLMLRQNALVAVTDLVERARAA